MLVALGRYRVNKGCRVASARRVLDGIAGAWVEKELLLLEGISIYRALRICTEQIQFSALQGDFPKAFIFILSLSLCVI